MTKEKILSFLNDHPDFALATSDGTVPHVRTLMLHKADETGIYFMVGKPKDVYRQISLNPKVELCFHHKNTQVRISGEAEKLEDVDLKKEVLESRPFMKEWIDRVGFKYMAVFRVKAGTATIWRLEDEPVPKKYIQL